jgi:hypothetical protein
MAISSAGWGMIYGFILGLLLGAAIAMFIVVMMD